MAPPTPDEILKKVQESLKDGPFACTSLVVLTGGNANFLYRGTLVKPFVDGLGDCGHQAHGALLGFNA